MFSNREPFVIEDKINYVLNGLDVSIMENFAKKFNFKTEYIRSNQPLNLAFHSEEAFQNFTRLNSYE